MIPSSVVEIEKFAFDSTGGLKKVEFAAGSRLERIQ